MPRRITNLSVSALVLTTMLLVGCQLSEPWQPVGGRNVEPSGPYVPLTTAAAPDQTLKSQLDGLPAHQRAYLAWLDTLLAGSSAAVVPFFRADSTATLQQVVVESLSQPQAELVLRRAFETFAVEGLILHRSARYTPASWDLRVDLAAAGEAGQSADLRGIFERSMTALGRSRLQGRVYLDAFRIDGSSLEMSLRDRRASIATLDVETSLRGLQALLGAEDAVFEAEPIFDGERLSQRIFRIKLRTPHSSQAPAALIGQLRWSPDGGPSSRPVAGHSDIYRRENR